MSSERCGHYVICFYAISKLWNCHWELLSFTDIVSGIQVKPFTSVFGCNTDMAAYFGSTSNPVRERPPPLKRRRLDAFSDDTDSDPQPDSDDTYHPNTAPSESTSSESTIWYVLTACILASASAHTYITERLHNRSTESLWSYKQNRKREGV